MTVYHTFYYVKFPPKSKGKLCTQSSLYIAKCTPPIYIYVYIITETYIYRCLYIAFIPQSYYICTTHATRAAIRVLASDSTQRTIVIS